MAGWSPFNGASTLLSTDTSQDPETQWLAKPACRVPPLGPEHLLSRGRVSPGLDHGDFVPLSVISEGLFGLSRWALTA